MAGATAETVSPTSSKMLGALFLLDAAVAPFYLSVLYFYSPSRWMMAPGDSSIERDCANGKKNKQRGKDTTRKKVIKNNTYYRLLSWSRNGLCWKGKGKLTESIEQHSERSWRSDGKETVRSLRRANRSIWEMNASLRSDNKSSVGNSSWSGITARRRVFPYLITRTKVVFAQ